MGKQGFPGQPEFADVVDGQKRIGAVRASAAHAGAHGQVFAQVQVQARQVVQVGEDAVGFHDQVVVRRPWDGQPREGGLHVACRHVGVDDHFQNVRPGQR